MKTKLVFASLGACLLVAAQVVLGAVNLVVSPSPVDVVSPSVGTSVKKTITISNTGTTAFMFTSIGLSQVTAGEFELCQTVAGPSCPALPTNLGGTISVGNDFVFDVQCTPNSTGTKMATIEFNHGASGVPSPYPVMVSCTTAPPLQFAVSPNTLTFTVSKGNCGPVQYLHITGNPPSFMATVPGTSPLFALCSGNCAPSAAFSSSLNASLPPAGGDLSVKYLGTFGSSTGAVDFTTVGPSPMPLGSVSLSGSGDCLQIKPPDDVLVCVFNCGPEFRFPYKIDWVMLVFISILVIPVAFGRVVGGFADTTVGRLGVGLTSLVLIFGLGTLGSLILTAVGAGFAANSLRTNARR